VEPYEIHFELTDEELWRASRRHWWRLIGSTYLGVAGALALLAGLLSCVCPLQEPFVVALWTAVALIGLQVLLTYRTYRHTHVAAQRFRIDRSVTMRFTEVGLEHARTNLAVSMPWALVPGVWQYDDMWLLLTVGGGLIVLPTASLNRSLRQVDHDRRTAGLICPVRRFGRSLGFCRLVACSSKRTEP